MDPGLSMGTCLDIVLLLFKSTSFTPSNLLFAIKQGRRIETELLVWWIAEFFTGCTIEYLKESSLDQGINCPISNMKDVNDFDQVISWCFSTFKVTLGIFKLDYLLFFDEHILTQEGTDFDMLIGIKLLFSFLLRPCKSLLTTMHDSNASSGARFRLVISHFIDWRIDCSLLLFSLFNLSFKTSRDDFESSSSFWKKIIE